MRNEYLLIDQPLEDIGRSDKAFPKTSQQTLSAVAPSFVNRKGPKMIASHSTAQRDYCPVIKMLQKRHHLSHEGGMAGEKQARAPDGRHLSPPKTSV